MAQCCQTPSTRKSFRNRPNRVKSRFEEAANVATKSGAESYAKIAVPLRAPVKAYPSIKKLNSSVAAEAVGLILLTGWLADGKFYRRSNEHSRARLNESTFDVRTKL